MRIHTARLKTIALLIAGLLLVATMQCAARSTAIAAPLCLGGCRVYLPLVERPFPVPQLSDPANGAHVVSLAPLLSWTPQISGTYLLQVSPDPLFSTTTISATNDVHTAQLIQHIPDGNLAPTTTYYWRVGLAEGDSYAFSSVWQFTTPQKNSALLPPRPQMLAPTNGAVLSATEATLSWRNVQNAQYYRVKVYGPDGKLFDAQILSALSTTYHVTGLTPGGTYSWEVKALNQYGWGTYPPRWTFTA